MTLDTAPPALHDTGSGPAVLLLHAFPLDASQWDAQVAALGDVYRCIRPDMWGCGVSPPPPPQPEATRTGLEAYATAVLSELDRRAVHRIAVVGISMGGYVALALWRLAPERISALCLCSTRAGADDDARRSTREQQAGRALQDQSVEFLVADAGTRLVAEWNQDEAHITDPVRGRIRRCTPEGVAFALRAMAARPDSSDLLGSITVPTLVVVGSGDRVIPLQEGRVLAEGIPGSRLLEMERCGHLPNLEDPPGFRAALRGFLEGARV